MNDDAAPQRDVTDDLVARHRGATTCKPRQDPARPDDTHPGLLVRSTLGKREWGERGTLLSRLLHFLFGTYLLDYTTSHVIGRKHAGADGGEHVVRGRVVGRACHLLEDAGGDLPDPTPLQEGKDLLASKAQVVFAVGLVEELPYLVPRPPAL